MRTCSGCGRSTPWVPPDETCDLCRKGRAAVVSRLRSDAGAEFVAAELVSKLGWDFDLYDASAEHGVSGTAYVRREGARLIITVHDESGDAVAEYVATIERRTADLRDIS